MAWTIDKPSDYFNTKLYTGTGSSLANTGVGFQPDLTWIKGRSGATEHVLTDSVRGVTKELSSNDAGVEETVAQGLTAFGSDGFTVGTDGSYNTSSATYAAWNFKANGAGSANTDGSQSATVSVNTTAGFSIVKFVNVTTATTNTFGHGLSVAPKVIIMRSLDSAYNWDVYHHKIAISKRLILNSTSAESSSTYMNSTSPTNQVFTVKSDEFANNDDCIAYCFADVQGYSKVGGSYTGNGNADGTFVYTGQKSAFIMLKNTTRAASWLMFDNKRLGYNVDNNEVVANTSAAEETYDQLDFLSNGFKMRTNGTSINLNGDTYIYMCFASNPFTTSTGVPATAR